MVVSSRCIFIDSVPSFSSRKCVWLFVSGLLRSHAYFPEDAGSSCCRIKPLYRYKVSWSNNRSAPRRRHEKPSRPTDTFTCKYKWQRCLCVDLNGGITLDSRRVPLTYRRIAATSNAHVKWQITANDAISRRVTADVIFLSRVHGKALVNRQAFEGDKLVLAINTYQ